MHLVTLHFSNLEDANWFARLARQSAAMSRRHAPLQSGIMQDAITRAADVVGPDPYPATLAPWEPHSTPVKWAARDMPIDYPAWETDGGTTAEQNEARFS